MLKTVRGPARSHVDDLDGDLALVAGYLDARRRQLGTVGGPGGPGEDVSCIDALRQEPPDGAHLPDIPGQLSSVAAIGADGK